MDKAKLFAAAEKAFLKGQNEKALEALEKIVRIDPNDVKALNKAADIYLKKQQLDKALEFLLRIGDIYTKDGFYSKAIAIYKRILKVNEGASKADLIGTHEKLASLYGQLGLVSDAMNHFKIVVDFYDQAGDREALLDVLRKVSDLDPNNADSQLKLAELFAQEGKTVESVETLERLVESLEPQGHLPEIIHVYEKWISLHPKNMKVLRKLIDAYISGGEPKKGLSKLQQAFRADPYNAEVLELLATSFRSMKQPDKARAVDLELIKIYRQNQDEEKASELEARLKGETPPESKKPDQKTVKKALVSDSIDPGDALIDHAQLDPQEKKILSECEVYLKYGLSDKAREVLTSSLGEFSQSIALRWKLKTVCQELKLNDEVERLLAEMLQLSKDKKLPEWTKAIQEEMGGGGQAVAAEMVPEASAPATAAKEEPGSVGFDTLGGFDDSEISIIVDEDDDAISGFHDEPEFVQELKEEALEQDSQNELENIEPVIELSGEQEAPAEGISLQTNELHEDGAEEFILSEADFSDDELQALQNQLAPEEAAKSEVAEVSAAEDAVEEKAEAIELVEVEEASLEILDSEPVGIEVSNDSGEVQADREFELRQALEEIEFFRSQGLDSEADELFTSLKTKYPDWDGKSVISTIENREQASDKVKKKELDLDVLGSKVKMQVQEDEREDGDFFDLAGELGEEIAEEQPVVARGVNDVFAAFKKGVSESISADDFQTHFDLGIAYREMGLVDDAIQEFKLCSKIEGKKVSSYYQLGLCEVARENFEEAIKYFDEALKEPKLDTQEKISLSYELADLLLQTDDKGRAAELLDEIIKIDPEFRDVQEKRELCRQSAQA